ncbi:MAG: methyltransferase domain-containing protein [Nitrospina sp.]|nr:MAG: methyltransferase domain-containing protein [Nitrospina sp.]TDJ58768.1 MAG: methyltransferase domain-containing protein [Nitrospina sp.]
MDDDQTQDGYSQADWQGHYDASDLRWDLGEVAPPFVRLWQDKILTPGKMIVPGCGQGHEVVFFAGHGWDVTGVDYSPGAVSLLNQTLKEKNLEARVLSQDFFALDATHRGIYDTLLEQTFFCAISPESRGDYVATAHRILKPGGFIMGLFYETGEQGGPPFNTTKQDIHKHFSKKFALVRVEKCDHSAEQRKDKEWLAVLKKK